MADSFGDAPDIRRLLTNPWVLGAGAIAVVLGVLIFKATSKQVPVGTGSQPGIPPTGLGNAGFSTDQMALSTGGIQQQLGALTAQLGQGFSSLQTQQANNPASYSLLNPPPDKAFHFGFGGINQQKPFFWELTPTGAQAFQQHTGQVWSGGVQSSASFMPPDWLPAYSYEVAQ